MDQTMGREQVSLSRIGSSAMVDGRQHHQFQSAVIAFLCQYLQELRITDQGRENLMSWQ